MTLLTTYIYNYCNFRFNDWKAKKIAKPQLLYEELSEKVSEMYDMLQFAWLARTEWKTMKEVGVV